MKVLRIEFSPKLILRFTAKEVELLMLSSQTHYDGVCKSYSRDHDCFDTANRFGPLLGLRNCIRNCGERYEHTLTWRNVDTLCKIAENVHCHHDPKDQKIVVGLGFAMGRLLRIANDSLPPDYKLTEDEVKNTTVL